MSINNLTHEVCKAVCSMRCNLNWEAIWRFSERKNKFLLVISVIHGSRWVSIINVATHKRKDRQTGDSEKVETYVPKPNSIPIFFNSCSSILIQFQLQFFQFQFHSSPVPYPTNSSPILFEFQPVPINSILQFYNSVQFYTRNWTELDLVHPYLQAKRRLFDLWYLTRRVFSSFHL